MAPIKRVLNCEPDPSDIQEGFASKEGDLEIPPATRAFQKEVYALRDRLLLHVLCRGLTGTLLTELVAVAAPEVAPSCNIQRDLAWAVQDERSQQRWRDAIRQICRVAELGADAAEVCRERWRLNR